MRHPIARRLVASLSLVAALSLASSPALARELRTVGTFWVPELETVRGLPIVSFAQLSDAGTRGAAWLQPLRLVKRLDAGSPLLLETLASGRRLQTVQVRLHASGSQPQVDWTLTDVSIVEHEVGPVKNDPAIYETISMRPAKMRMDVTTPSGTVGTCWDWGQSRPC